MPAAAACAHTRLGTTMLTFAARMPTSPEPEAGRGAAAECKGRDVHPQLWQACAGSMCAVPPVRILNRREEEDEQHTRTQWTHDDLLLQSGSVSDCIAMLI